MRFGLVCAALLASNWGLVAAAFAGSSEPAQCVAVYGALAQEQASMGAAGASAISSAAPNYDKIKFADRVSAIEQKYPNDPGIKYGLMTGGADIEGVQKRYYQMLLLADSAGKFDKDALSVLTLAAQCDKDEGFSPALTLAGSTTKDRPANEQPLAAVDDVACLFTYGFAMNSPDKLTPGDREKIARNVSSAMDRYRKAHGDKEENWKADFQARAIEFDKQVKANQMTVAVVAARLATCNKRYE